MFTKQIMNELQALIEAVSNCSNNEEAKGNFLKKILGSASRPDRHTTDWRRI